MVVGCVVGGKSLVEKWPEYMQVTSITCFAPPTKREEWQETAGGSRQGDFWGATDEAGQVWVNSDRIRTKCRAAISTETALPCHTDLVTFHSTAVETEPDAFTVHYERRILETLGSISLTVPSAVGTTNAMSALPY